MNRDTLIKKVRRKMRENRVYIDKTIDLSEVESMFLIVDSGCTFLEKIYGRESAAYMKHSRSKMFWSWYRLQWYGVEESFIHYLTRTNLKRPQSMTRNQYQQYMEFYCIAAVRIDEAFKNYLKSSK